jgi:hypothetical protein
VDAHQEAELLLLVGDREPVLHQRDPRAHQHPLELRHVLEELLDLILAGEAHHPLDAGAVVPGAVEQHDLAAPPADAARSAGNTTGVFSRRTAPAAPRRGRCAG